MKNKIEWKYVWQFFLFWALQVFLVNYVSIWGFLTPMLYLLFILSLPFQTPRWLVVLSGFLLGFGVDCFSGMMGVHAAATTLVAFARPLLMQLVPHAPIEEHMRPVLPDMHLGWYAGYAMLMSFIHQFFVFFLDAFSLANFGHLCWISLVNAFFTALVMVLVQCLFYSSSKRY